MVSRLLVRVLLWFISCDFEGMFKVATETATDGVWAILLFIIVVFSVEVLVINLLMILRIYLIGALGGTVTVVASVTGCVFTVVRLV